MNEIIYLNPAYPPKERAKDLLSRMSLEEKFGQIQGEFIEKVGTDENHSCTVGSISCLAASLWEDRQRTVERIREVQSFIMEKSEHHIPAFFHIETATGVLAPEMTVFPNELARASSFDPSLEKKIGSVIGSEARACGISHGLAPVLDISRDPRLGRQGESYGEDPTLASAMGAAYVQGLQHNEKPDKGIMACGKHFLGFMNSMGGIHGARSLANDRELREVYGKVFQAAIGKADLRSVMNCYSVINGIPAAGNQALLTGLLREEMGFQGLVAADYASVEQIYTVHRMRESMALAGEMALEAGLDCELPTVKTFTEEMLEHFRSGEADPAILNQAAERILTEKFRLGLFEKPFPESDEKLAASIRTEKAQQLSLKSARESIVLLKNNGVLPIRNRKKIALIGWHANTTRAFFGCYMNFARQECRLGAASTMAGTEGAEQTKGYISRKTYPGSPVILEHPDTDALARECYPGMRSVYEELKKRCPEMEVRYSYGYPFTGNDDSYFEEALGAAAEADLVIVTLGGRYGWTTGCTTGEGIDSMNINLPECQEQFLRELKKLHKPTVGLHFDGRPCSSDAADELDALLECWTSGVHGQQAVVDILLGTCSPSGKLPVSIARNSGQIPVFYSHERGSGEAQAYSVCFQDYLDGSHAPRYAFGHGLTYTTFEYTEFITDKKQYHWNERVIVSCKVKNTGSETGTDTVQLYVTDEFASISRPVMELIGFARVPLEAGEEKRVCFTVYPSQFAFLGVDFPNDKRWKIEAGEYTLKLGHASDDIVTEQSIEIHEDAWIDGRDREFYADAEIEKE